MAQPQPTTGGKMEGLSDLAYDLVTTLSECGEAIDVLDQYIDDAKRANENNVCRVFEEIRSDEVKHCNMLRNAIDQMCRQGKFQ